MRFDAFAPTMSQRCTNNSGFCIVIALGTTLLLRRMRRPVSVWDCVFHNESILRVLSLGWMHAHVAKHSLRVAVVAVSVIDLYVTFIVNWFECFILSAIFNVPEF